MESLRAYGARSPVEDADDHHGHCDAFGRPDRPEGGRTPVQHRRSSSGEVLHHGRRICRSCRPWLVPHPRTGRRQRGQQCVGHQESAPRPNYIRSLVCAQLNGGSGRTAAPLVGRHPAISARELSADPEDHVHDLARGAVRQL